ncbi:MAG: hypothetical protein KDD82_26115, partial [Planctomycetes bacterium]|nr:hypothetical protein [Planctomycetota bacterium]
PLDRLSPSEATEELQTLLNGFQTRRALPLAEALVARAPSERLPALLLAETQAELGRYDEAWAGFQRAFEREPGLRQQLSSRRYQVLQAYAEQTSWRGEPLPARWEQALGGHWRVEPGGEVVGTGGGLGTYELTALFDREAPTAPGYRLEVEVNRDPQGEGPALQAYAGVILGARSRGDFFTVFFVQNRRETDGMLAERGGAAAYRETHGVEPVVVRVTHQDGPRWRFPAEGGRLVPPQRGPWSKLALEVDGSRLQAWVDGEPVLDLQLARPLDGRVGLLKYYVHEFRYRNWTVTPR